MNPLPQDEETVDFLDMPAFQTEYRAANPRIRFFDLRHLRSRVTPEDEFFTFHQTTTVRADAESWRLQIGGFVDNPRRFTLNEIKQRSDRRDQTVTLECSGNGTGPEVNGLVSTGVWTGVGLSSILKECGAQSQAREVAFLGMDVERLAPDYISPHGRSIYIQDALQPEPILAFALNGKPLSADQGFPLRLILPGWYGMAQIKWLTRIEVMDRRYEGQHMARNYHTMNTVQYPKGELWLETSISRTRLKSVCVRVTRRTQPGGASTYRIYGAAWGGSAALKSVEVKVDEGSWQPARISTPGNLHSWSLWVYDWKDVSPGRHVIVSRATDVNGNVQPTAEERQKTVKSARENNSQWPREILIQV